MPGDPPLWSSLPLAFKFLAVLFLALLLFLGLCLELGRDKT